MIPKDFVILAKRILKKDGFYDFLKSNISPEIWRAHEKEIKEDFTNLVICESWKEITGEEV